MSGFSSRSTLPPIRDLPGMSAVALVADLPSPAERPVVSSKRRWQFDLRALFVGLAALSLTFAAMAAAGWAASLLFIWLALLVSAHVLANAWGTHTWRPGAAPYLAQAPPEHALDRGQVPRDAFAPTTLLSDDRAIDRVALRGSIYGAAMAGGLGAAGLARLYGHRPGGWWAVAVAAPAAMVLGAILGSVLATCLSVIWSAFREAARGGPETEGSLSRWSLRWPFRRV